MTKISSSIYTALVTPYTCDGINTDMLQKLVELNRKNGINRFFVCGSAAEMALLSVGERKEILAAVKAMSPECVIAHVGGQNPAECFELARDAAAKKADAIAAVAPYYYKYSISEFTAYYQKLSDVSGLPVILYNVPGYSGISYTTAQLAEIASLDCVAAIKFTSNDLFQLERLKRLVPDKPIFNGCDELLHFGLSAGADSAIGATFNVTGDKAVKLFSAYKAGNIDLCRELQREINDIIAVTSKLGGLKCVKALLCMLGYDVGKLREPFEPLSKEDLDILCRDVLPLITIKR